MPYVEPRRPLLGSTGVERAARWGIVAWTLIGVGILGYWAYSYLVYPVRAIFPPLIVATIVVYLLNPLVTRLERRGIRRGWGTLLVYVVFFIGVGLLMRWLTPIISAQVAAFVRSVPSLVSRAGTEVQALADRANLTLRVEDLVNQIQANQDQAFRFLGRIASFTGGVIHAAVVVVLGPILAFYLLVDLPKLRRGVIAAIPANRRDEVLSVSHKLAVSVGGFFRGQLLVALFVGLASMLALWLVGLPYWALVGVICGIFNLVPMIGPYIGGIPALFIAFTTPANGGGPFDFAPGWPLAIASAVALFAVQQIDNHIISPNVVARTVKLHPVTVMLSLLAGGTLLGLWGMVFAVPAVAAVKIVGVHWWDTRAQWPPPPPGPEEPASEEPEPEPEEPEPSPGRARALLARMRRPRR